MVDVRYIHCVQESSKYFVSISHGTPRLPRTPPTRGQDYAGCLTHPGGFSVTLPNNG